MTSAVVTMSHSPLMEFIHDRVRSARARPWNTLASALVFTLRG
jgi:hypothetical protein